MSEESVEIVRRYYGVLDDVLERYWAGPHVQRWPDQCHRHYTERGDALEAARLAR
ncbi:MAG TPA: hypothetical protein VI028_05970 [Solirubrobacterales bacterium]